MEYLVLFVVILVIAATIKRFNDGTLTPHSEEKIADVYQYSRKESIMTKAESAFYQRLMSVAGDRYFIFPQVHLSALLNNQTKGHYWKAAFQRSNRTSVDYILCDKETMKTIYA